jgi:predicted nucleotidyltransferase
MADLLDESARMRIAAALNREGVVAALLHRSQATGRAGPGSDIDVGVWVDPMLDADARLDLRLELIREIGEALDLVVLNDASPLLVQRARQSGVLLVDREPRTRIRLETRALIEYLDTKPLRDELATGTRNRLAEGRFGR